MTSMRRTPDPIPDFAITGDLAEFTPAEVDTTIAALNGRIAVQRKRHQQGAMATVPADPAELTHLEKLRDLLENWHQCNGRWPRYWLVDSVNGHVHRNTHSGYCSRTWRTEYYWLTAYSGVSEDEMIRIAGDRVCTNCYPDAPVEARNRPSELRTTTELAREQAAAQRRERAAEKAAKAITNPDGSPLRVPDNCGYTDKLATARAAELRAVEILINARYARRELTQYDIRALRLITAALAAKRGSTVDAELSVIDGKYRAKCKREQLVATPWTWALKTQARWEMQGEH